MHTQLYLVELKDRDGLWHVVCHCKVLVDPLTYAEVMGEIKRHCAALEWVSEVGFIRPFPSEEVSV